VSDSFSFLDALILKLNFGDEEKRILGLFYDERLKVRHKKVAIFQFYAKLCEGHPVLEWPGIMNRADISILNLKQIHYVQKAAANGTMLPALVGPAADLYELTADGLEVLQAIHLPLALKLRAWIAVLPPWFVAIGAIAGGITAAWKLIDFGVQLAHHFYGS